MFSSNDSLPKAKIKSLEGIFKVVCGQNKVEENSLSQSIDFQDIKQLLLETTSLTSIISDPQYSTKSLYLFWALDALENDTVAKNDIFRSNRDILKSIQQEVCTDKTIDSILEKYSSGFVLGLLEFTIRSLEANIETYDEYQQLVELLQSWQKKGFASELIEKQYNETVKAIQEINDWHETKKEEYFPIIFQLINSSRYQRSEKQILKFIQKRCQNEITVFYILSGLLRTNPLLHNKIRDLCIEKHVNLEELHQKLILVMKLLKDETKDPKVKKFIELFNQK
ncbi:MAG: hypothetical protein ACXAC5_18085 [Promethearchaeota archaeon]